MINIAFQMGHCCCPCLFPNKGKNKQSYDVHEQTFQIEQNNDERLNQVPQYFSTQQVLSQDGNSQEDKIKSYPSQSGKNREQTSKLVEKELLASEDKILQNVHEIMAKNKNQDNLQSQIVKNEKNSHILQRKISTKKKYNADDYRYLKQQKSFKVKAIDSIKMQQYNIDNCLQCNFFIFDITANVYIDDCKDCFIYIAPCQGSIFVRNCSNVNIIAACKQFRTVQCYTCSFSLYCKSQPVIESSSKLIFSPFQAPNYPELKEQFQQIKFDVWNNNWFQIYNFTPKADQKHYVLTKTIPELQYISWQQAFKMAQLQYNIKGIRSFYPIIYGEIEIKSQQQAFIIFNEQITQKDQQILQILKDCIIIKTLKGKLKGQGKHQKIAALIGYNQPSIVSTLEKIAQVHTKQSSIKELSQKFFMNFRDQR